MSKSRNQLLEDISGATFDIRNNATIAGYGSIGVDALGAPFTINSTPKTLDGFDTELISSPRGVTQDLVTNSLALGVKGVWTLMFKIALEFDELNAGRRLAVQLYNLDTATPASTIFRFGVGRNVSATTLSIVLPFEVSASSVGQKYQLQIFSENGTFSNVVDIGSTYSFVNNSPVTELF